MTLYLDTSSLVKLFVGETGSDDVRRLVDQADTVTTSIVAYAETRAALARLRRTAVLTATNFAAAKRAFEDLWPSVLAVEVQAPVSREAGEFAERYALRGFDALHLATFVRIARAAKPTPVRFSSFDVPLSRAAAALARRIEQR